MNQISSPYFDTKLYTQVVLKPEDMNNDILLNLKENLQRNKLNKCDRDGFITKIYKIDQRDNGILLPEDFSASCKFNVKYSARICNPIEKTRIVCQVDKIYSKFILAVNGPIKVIIKTDNVDNKCFKRDMSNNLLCIENKVERNLNLNDFVIVNILAKKFSTNDICISVFGYLERIASREEVDNFFYLRNIDDLDNQEEEDKLDNIEVSDDEMIDDSPEIPQLSDSESGNQSDGSNEGSESDTEADNYIDI